VAHSEQPINSLFRLRLALAECVRRRGDGTRSGEGASQGHDCTGTPRVGAHRVVLEQTATSSARVRGLTTTTDEDTTRRARCVDRSRKGTKRGAAHGTRGTDDRQEVPDRTSRTGTTSATGHADGTLDTFVTLETLRTLNTSGTCGTCNACRADRTRRTYGRDTYRAYRTSATGAAPGRRARCTSRTTRTRTTNRTCGTGRARGAGR